MDSDLQVIRSYNSPSRATVSERNPVVIPCPHCNDPSNEACLGDGLCHHGKRRIEGLFSVDHLPPSEWRSDAQCYAAYRRTTGEWNARIVPCRYCNGYRFLLIGDDGTPVPIRLPEER